MKPIKRIFLILALSLIPVMAQAAPSKISVLYADGTFALTPPLYVDARVLAANVAESHTVPTFVGTDAATHYANYVLFSGNCDFYAAYGGAAAVPGADVTNGTASELNPKVRYLGGAYTAIGVIAPTACIITMSYFR